MTTGHNSPCGSCGLSSWQVATTHSHCSKWPQYTAHAAIMDYPQENWPQSPRMRSGLSPTVPQDNKTPHNTQSMRQSWTIIMKSGRNLLGWCPGRQAMAGNKLLKQIELAHVNTVFLSGRRCLTAAVPVESPCCSCRAMAYSCNPSGESLPQL